jgi:putative cell wall-binding protein
VRIGGRQGAKAPRLVVAVLLACALAGAGASAHVALAESSSVAPSVTIQIPSSSDRSPDGWDKPPLIAQIIPQGPGIVLYRFGAGPGPWQPCLGPVIIPPGKQTMSAVLIAPDGTPGPIETITARSDIHAMALSGTAAAASRATYGGASSVAGAVTVSVLVGRQLGTLIRRLGGSDRYDTSTIISAAEPTHGTTVIIATGEKFPDALTASGLAGCLDAPVLLVSRTSIPPKVASEIKRLGARHAIICGGTPSVSSSVESELRHLGLTTERLAGKTRYETAVAIAKRIRKITGKSDRVFLARGDMFPDALIVSPLAYTTHAPILLSGTDKLWDSTAAQITSARYRSATIIGGGMNSRAEQGVRNRVPAVDRWAGSNQYDTSVQVAAISVNDGTESWGYVGIARGDIFPDALCGGVLAGKQRGVILLTPPAALDAAVADALTAHTADVRRCEVYGSDQAVSAAVYNQISTIFH